MVTYKEITNHYRLGRARYPPAHPKLTKKQAVVWRLLQTNMYPSPVSCSRFYPGNYTELCKICNNRADLPHILWACPQAEPFEGRQIKDQGKWAALLLSSDHHEQDWATRLAERAAEIQDISAVS